MKKLEFRHKKHLTVPGILLVFLLMGGGVFCGRKNSSNPPPTEGLITVGEQEVNDVELEPVNAQLVEGIWVIEPKNTCKDNKCTKYSAEIPVKERDLLVINNLKARGVTAGKYKNNPWIYLKYSTNHADYLNQEIKLCFQNKFIVKNGNEYLEYIRDDFQLVRDLNIARVVPADKNCWSGSDSLIDLYKNNTWHEDAQSQLQQLLVVGSGNNTVVVVLGDSFKDNSTNKRIDSEVLLEIEAK